MPGWFQTAVFTSGMFIWGFFFFMIIKCYREEKAASNSKSETIEVEEQGDIPVQFIR